MGAPVKIQTSPMRRAAFERDGGICAHCQADCEKIKRVYFRILDEDAQMFYGDLVRYNDKVFWEADHIIERADKGADAIDNIQTLCRPCHIVKTKLARQERGSQNTFIRITGEEILIMIESAGAGLKIGGPTGILSYQLIDESIRTLVAGNRPAVITALRQRDGQRIRATAEYLGYID